MVMLIRSPSVKPAFVMSSSVKSSMAAPNSLYDVILPFRVGRFSALLSSSEQAVVTNDRQISAMKMEYAACHSSFDCEVFMY